MSKKCCLSAVLVLMLVASAYGQSLQTQINPFVLFPSEESKKVWGVGVGAMNEWHLRLPAGIPVLSQLEPFLVAGYQAVPLETPESPPWLTLLSAGAGLEYADYLTDRLGGGLSADAGLYQGTYQGLSALNYFWRVGGNLKFRLSPAFQVGLGASWQSYLSGASTLADGMGVHLNLQVALDGFQQAGRIEVGKIDLLPVYPVLYSQYDKESLGKVTLTNREDGEIQNLRVSLFIKQYMERPKESFRQSRVPRGGLVEAPLFALLTSDTLKLIENTKVLAEITVEYEFLGSPRKQTFESSLRVYNRNALTWDDDRKASAFVSSKDPAVLRYAKYVAGIIRNHPLQGLGNNLKYAMGLFECLRLVGINYVVDPTTPYAEFSSNASAVDFLQFPFQTLTYKGGDCDDLSILFASVLESVGIQTAFITVPGHIYMAFALDLSEKDVNSLFASSENFIVQDGRYWVPLEITLLGADFAKAWSIGAQEWKQAGSAAKLFPMNTSWSHFDPVSPPDQDTRITLPSSQEVTTQVSTGVSRFAEAVMTPKLALLKSDLEAATDKGRAWNRIGLLQVKYGQFETARDSFLLAQKLGYGLAETNLGNIALVLKDYKTAQARFLNSSKTNPTDFPTFVGLALSYYQAEQFGQASEVYRKLVDLDTEKARNYQYLMKEGTTP